jgi:hypothetical protein
MKILAWNYRGLSRASAIRSLRGKIRFHSPDMLFLLETKLQHLQSSIILNSLGFYLMLHAPPSSTKGGLLLAWRHGVNLVCCSSSTNILSTWCYYDPSDKTLGYFFAFMVLLYIKIKLGFGILFWMWEKIIMGLNYTLVTLRLLWALIFSQSDKQGGRPYASYSTNASHGFLDSCGMVYLGFSGNPCTWFNKRRDHHLIKECLDRGIANSNWVHLFPHYSIQHLLAYSSDHNPIVLNTALIDLTLDLKNFGRMILPVGPLFHLHGVLI